MRYAIISDVHGNLEALEAVLKAARDEGVRKVFCVGDIVGYGANPKECIEIIKRKNIICVAGNHDWAACDKKPLEDFTEVAAKSLEWTRHQLNQEEKEFLDDLKLIYKSEHFMMVHGSLNHPEQFNYLNDMTKTADTFFQMDRRVCFIGHTHVPGIFVNDGHRVDLSSREVFQVEPDNKYIVNVGSVGQPRHYSSNAPLCIFDPDLWRIEFKEVPYNVQLAQDKILAAGLPDVLARRLAVGT